MMMMMMMMIMMTSDNDGNGVENGQYFVATPAAMIGAKDDVDCPCMLKE